MLKKQFWITCPKFTVQVDVVKGKIVTAAPLVRVFIGQPLDNLLKWARSFGLTETRLMLK